MCSHPHALLTGLSVFWVKSFCTFLPFLFLGSSLVSEFKKFSCLFLGSRFRIQILSFWAYLIRFRFSEVRILPSSSKNIKKNLDFYYFATFYLWGVVQICLQKVVSKETDKKLFFFCRQLEGHWRKEQNLEVDPECHGSGTLLGSIRDTVV